MRRSSDCTCLCCARYSFELVCCPCFEHEFGQLIVKKDSKILKECRQITRSSFALSSCMCCDVCVYTCIQTTIMNQQFYSLLSLSQLCSLAKFWIWTISDEWRACHSQEWDHEVIFCWSWTKLKDYSMYMCVEVWCTVWSHTVTNLVCVLFASLHRCWTCFEECIVRHIDELKDRHIDQFIMCSIYAIGKVRMCGPLFFAHCCAFATCTWRISVF